MTAYPLNFFFLLPKYKQLVECARHVYEHYIQNKVGKHRSCFGLLSISSSSVYVSACRFPAGQILRMTEIKRHFFACQILQKMILIQSANRQ